MTRESITLRAHHGMCLAFFEGKGYSNEFSSHMQSVLKGMEENPKLQLIEEGDIICSKCPNLRDGMCNTADLVHSYDKQVLAHCGLTENCEIRWKDFSSLVINKIIRQGKREQICGDCRWTELCKHAEGRLL